MSYRTLAVAAMVAAFLPVQGTARSDDVAVKNSVFNQSFGIRQWTSEEGLPLNHITCVQQSADGYLWIGTWMGLARFDGQRFATFNRLNTPAFQGQRGDSINALTQENDGTLWVATCDGLVSYRDGRFRKFTKSSGLPSDDIWRSVRAASGGLWLQAGDYVLRFKDGRVLGTPARLPEDTVLSLNETSDGALNILSPHRWLILLPNGTTLQTKQLVGPSEQPWRAAAIDQAGSIWFGDGAVLTPPSNSAPQNVSFADREVYFLYPDRSGHLWAAAKSAGLRRRIGNEWVTIDVGDRFRGASVICMTEDFEGNYWLGTSTGLFALHPKWVVSYDTSDGLADDYVWSICESTDGIIWAATDQGLSFMLEGRWKPLVPGEVESNLRDRTVWPGPQGSVFVAKQGGATLWYDPKRKPPWSWVTGAHPADVNALYTDRSGRLWVGSSEGLLVFEHGKELTNAPELRLLRGQDVRSILQDRSGAFWFGTRYHGLIQVRNGSARGIGTSEGLSGTNVWTIHEDGDGVIWFGTGNGLTRYAGGRFCAFRTDQGLIENTINQILEDDFENLWLSGLRGIHRVRRADLNAVAESRLANVACFTVTTADGMKSPETNGETQPAGWKARDGCLWFPTKRGVVVLDPGIVPLDAAPPRVALEEVKADDRLIFSDRNTEPGTAGSLRPGIEQPPKRILKKRIEPRHATVLEFCYTATTFVAPERARFRYRLLGVDRDWRDETYERAARYISLRPGEYRFEVKAANHHNVWSAAPVSFEFIIVPYFWQTWLFYALCAGLTVALAAAFQAYQLRWQRRLLKLEELRAVASERSRIARDLHDDLGGTLTGLALQLEAAGRKGKANQEELLLFAQDARSLSRELRELAWATNPKCDSAGSLAAFIAEVTDRFCQGLNLECRLQLPASGAADEVPARVRYELLAVLKESLANIAKHAQARIIAVELNASNGEIRLTIRDDGRGFEPGRSVTGTGLRNLRERLEQVGGYLTVESSPGAGTMITACVPWPVRTSL